MSDKNDFGFYGQGLDGYVHYKQSFDQINSNLNNSGKLRSHKDDSNGKTGIYILGKRKTGWQAFR